MNPHESNARPVTDERLSAYFDGEASPEERSAVENLLDDSLVARRELDEISQLSALLHSFPRESAPAELVTNVQRQTDQMPLAAQAVTPAVPARSLRREWTAAVSGAVVTAAALFVMASVVDNTGPRGLPSYVRSEPVQTGLAADRGDAQHGQLMTAAVAEPADGPIPVAAVATGLGGAGGTPRNADGVEAKAMTRPQATETASKMAAPLAAKAPAGDAASDAAIVANAGSDSVRESQQSLGLGNQLLDNGAVQNFYVNNTDFLNGLKVGEVYRFVPQVADNGSNVAVVNLAVLDVERSADRVQVILSQNSIQPRLAGQSKDVKNRKTQQSRDQSGTAGNEMVVVFTVGPGEQLAKTLEDMQRHPDLFVGWSSEPPVQLPTGEELAALKEEAANSKDGTALAEKPTADKSSTAKQKADRQLTERSKMAASTDDDMDEEAELALNALLVRNTYVNSGFANFNDSNTANYGVRAFQQGAPGDVKPFSRAGVSASPAGAPNTSAAQSAKTLPADPKQAPPSAVRSQTGADNVGKGDSTAKKSGDQKQDADARRELERRSSYQTTFRVPTDAAPLAEQAPQLNRSSMQGFENTLNRTRRGVGNAMQQQIESNSRATANTPADANRVKVLFVLHPMPAPAAAPAGKQNP